MKMGLNVKYIYGKSSKAPQAHKEKEKWILVRMLNAYLFSTRLKEIAFRGHFLVVEETT